MISVRQDAVPAKIAITFERGIAVEQPRRAGFQANENPAPPHSGDGKRHVHAG